VQPVATVAEVRAADAAALTQVCQSVLVTRAGTAVARAALGMLGGGYGRRVVVVAGKGNNGADGRVAASLLTRRGALVRVVDATDPGPLDRCDLVIDAAYGTGFKGSYDAPLVPSGALVLAVDVPSGVNADTGAAPGTPMPATRTVSFAAFKPGLLQGDGARLAGQVEVADIGVAVDTPGIGLIEDADVTGHLARRDPDAHKWASAVAIVAGSPGMEGSAALSARGASHAGAGMVRLAVPGADGPDGSGGAGPWPLEAVRLGLPGEGWAGQVLEVLERCRALVVGPGLGRTEATQAEIRRVIAESPVPVVADADALFALGDAAQAREVVTAAVHPVILTPHDGEYQGLAGRPPGPDRVSAARDLAERCGAVVLLKGSLTALAAPATVPAGDLPGVLLAAAGTSRLATAGTGDVLSGIIGAMVARGLPVLMAGALGAHVHGRASGLGHGEGLVAGDLPGLVADWLSEAMGATHGGDGGHG
jgi:NAD(P)H-hydrate epimerase